MNEYRLTDRFGQTMLFAADSAKTAATYAKRDGHTIVKVEKFESGWVKLKDSCWRE